ncbi:phage protein [Streptococcus pneumoniae]|nr:phage protein [Streptococcus pneumoniae]
MFSLSRESEHDLTHGILEVVERYLEAREKVPPRLTKLINRVELKEELKISDNTLNKWESQGLRRYQPPDDGARIIFFSDDIRRFMGWRMVDITHTQRKAEVIIMTLNCISTVADLWNSSKNKSY